MRTIDPLEYVLNRMEAAAHHYNPAKAGYGEARKELIDGITGLRAENERLRRAMEDLVAVFVWDDGAHDYTIGDYDDALPQARAAIRAAEGE